MKYYLDVVDTPVPSLTPSLAPATPKPIPSNSPASIHLVYSGATYSHLQGIFEFPLPDNWELVRENEGDAEFNDLSARISVHLMVTNTGLPLDKESFQRFVSAQEQNLFSVYPEYLEIESQFDQVSQTIEVEKRVKFKGEKQNIVSLYRQSGETILNLDIWSSSLISATSLDEYKSFFANIQMFSDKISSQPIYRWVYEFLTDNGFYSGSIPLQWTRERISSETAQTDRFTSPDLQAVIQITQYDDGEWLSKKDAGFIALMLLREDYEPDLTITEDRVLPDGGEFLFWSTAQGGLTGVTHFEVNDNNMKITTWHYPSAQENIYKELMQTIFESIRSVK